MGLYTCESTKCGDARGPVRVHLLQCVSTLFHHPGATSPSMPTCFNGRVAAHPDLDPLQRQPEVLLHLLPLLTPHVALSAQILTVTITTCSRVQAPWAQVTGQGKA